MTETDKPSDKYGVTRNEDGGVLVEFYRPDGVLASRVLFDQTAAAEFAHTLVGVVLGTAADQ